MNLYIYLQLSLQISRRNQECLITAFSIDGMVMV